MKDITKIFTLIKANTKKEGYIVVEVANIKNEFVTPLAWDVCKAISQTLVFEREIVINWQSNIPHENGTYGYGYDHSYCLIFRNT